MAHDSEWQREGTAMAANRHGIQVGWTVYDLHERPIGNVTGLEGEQLEIDGRPEGHGYFRVAENAVRSVEDGKVYLSVAMEDLPMESEPRPTRTSGEAEMAASAFQATSPVGEAAGGNVPATAPEDARSATTWNSDLKADDRPAGLHGSYTASAHPVEVEGSPWTRYALWITPVGVGAASATAYAWWRNRQARRGRLKMLARAFATAGSSMTPVMDAARERKRAWWAAPLGIVLPLAALYLRSSTADKGRLEAASSRVPDGRLKGRLPTFEVPTPGLPSVSVQPPPLWTAAVPVLGAALAAAWLASRQRRFTPPRLRPRDTRLLRDIMTRDVEVVRPEASIFEAASMMKRLDAGFLPVCDGKRLQGVLTDRDIVVRPVADSQDPQLTAVRNAMSPEVTYAFEDDPVDRGAELMRQHRIRRLPIVDREKNLVGVVSLGDLAVDTGDERLSGSTLEQVSEPAHPRR